MSITKETEKAFKIIFCEYKRLRKLGYAKEDSLTFEDEVLYNLPAFSNWPKSDINLAVKELVSVGFAKENICGDITITPVGVKYMEEKPQKFFEELSNVFDLIKILG